MMGTLKATKAQLALAERLGINVLSPDSSRSEARHVLDAELHERRIEQSEKRVVAAARVVKALGIRPGSIIRYSSGLYVVKDFMSQGVMLSIELPSHHSHEISPVFYNKESGEYQATVELVYQPEAGFLHLYCQGLYDSGDDMRARARFRTYVRENLAEIAEVDRYENEYGLFIRQTAIGAVRERYQDDRMAADRQREAVKRALQVRSHEKWKRHCLVCGTITTANSSKRCPHCLDIKAEDDARHCVFCGQRFTKGQDGASTFACAQHAAKKTLGATL